MTITGNRTGSNLRLEYCRGWHRDHAIRFASGEIPGVDYESKKWKHCLMKPLWMKSARTMEQLQEKSVEFDLYIEGRRFQGRGFFLARQKGPEAPDWLAIELVVNQPNEGNIDQFRRELTREMVACIKDHPDQSVAAFSLIFRDNDNGLMKFGQSDRPGMV